MKKGKGQAKKPPMDKQPKAAKTKAPKQAKMAHRDKEF